MQVAQCWKSEIGDTVLNEQVAVLAVGEECVDYAGSTSWKTSTWETKNGMVVSHYRGC